MNRKLAYIICYGLPVPLVIVSLFIGSSGFSEMLFYIKSGSQLISGQALHHQEAARYKIMHNILLNVRLPRVLLTFLIGAALSTSGSILQGMFRNPLVDSYVLGISSGAALGAALAISFVWVPVNIAAFAGGIMAVLLTYSIATSGRRTSIVSIVLSGMVISGMFTAGLAIVQYISNPYKLQAIVQWTMGNLHMVSWTELQQVYIPIIITLIVVYIYKWRINILSLGDDAVIASGVNPTIDKLVFITAATLLTSISVAAAGIISFYGLFMPHIVRMMLGADNRITMPANIFLGGSFLLMIDNFSRSLFAFEVPVGIFTMLLGGSFFIYLMRKNKLNWN